MSDVTLAAITSALTGLSERQRVIADNTANISTPGFLAGRVQFETALEQALHSGSSSEIAPSVTRSLDPTRPDGNNVNLEQETLDGLETMLRYQLMIHAADNKFGQLRDVLRGS